MSKWTKERIQDRFQSSRAALQAGKTMSFFPPDKPGQHLFGPRIGGLVCATPLYVCHIMAICGRPARFEVVGFIMIDGIRRWCRGQGFLPAKDWATLCRMFCRVHNNADPTRVVMLTAKYLDPFFPTGCLVGIMAGEDENLRLDDKQNLPTRVLTDTKVKDITSWSQKHSIWAGEEMPIEKRQQPQCGEEEPW